MKKKTRLFPAFSNRSMFVGALLLVIYGTFMIVSAEVSRDTGQNSAIIFSFLKQALYVVLGVIGMSLTSRVPLQRLRMSLFDTAYIIGAAALILPRFMGAYGGAYGWIRLGPISIQPSEFAKFFMIAYVARLCAKDLGPERNRMRFNKAVLRAAVYVIIIAFIEKDFGSAAVLLGIVYVMLMSNPKPGLNKNMHIMMTLIFVGIFSLLFLLSPIGTSILSKVGGYKAKRFLASANPFADPYDSGYHLIMGLVSFATGGWTGVGYGNSIHKYMNFPNPSSDFIFAVIIEEMGILFGLIPIAVLYFMILKPLFTYSLKIKSDTSRMILSGVFTYFILHIILNVGGVTGLIPLTGVPLLLVSSGGSSLMAALMSLGMAQYEIVQYRNPGVK